MRNPLGLLLLCAGFASACAQTASTPLASPVASTASESSKSVRHTCSIHTEPPTAGDEAYAAGKYAEAITLYADQMKSPGWAGDSAHNNLIRVQLASNKVPEAHANADAWLKSSPQDAWSTLAAAEVAWREGRLLDAIGGFLQAEKLDYCNPQAHAEHARVLAMTSMYATAKAELDLAHKLDPNDLVITSRWLRYQPHESQLQNLKSRLDDAVLSDSQRSSLEENIARFAAPQNACRIDTAVGSTSIPFRSIKQDGPQSTPAWGLDVMLNGSKRRLLLDTGASGLLLSKIAADNLHLTPEFKSSSHGIGDQGSVDSYVAKVDSIRIGSLEFHDCDVTVLKSSRNMSGSTGLIGADVFAQFLVTLDFPGHAVKLDPLPPRPGQAAPAVASLDTGDEASEAQAPQNAYVDPSMANWTTVYHVGSHLFLPVSVNSTPRRLFLIDSGAGLSTISPELGRSVSKLSGDTDIRVFGISGEVAKVYVTGPLTLDFGTLRQPVTEMVSMSISMLSSEAGVDVAGILGVLTLHQLTVSIDYRDSKVKFSFDPKRLENPCAGALNLADCGQ